MRVEKCICGAEPKPMPGFVLKFYVCSNKKCVLGQHLGGMRDFLWNQVQRYLQRAIRAKGKGGKVVMRGYVCNAVGRDVICGGPLPGGCSASLQKKSRCRRVVVVEAGK